MINLTVNGKLRETDDDLSLEQFLTTIDVNLRFVAVGYNGEVVKKDSFGNITLSSGDTLEIVRPVGGG